MAIVAKKQAAVPAGTHKGIIIGAEETSKVFDPSKGPEPVVEIVIQPAWKTDDGAETLPVLVSFTPILNGISALSRFLKRVGAEPEEGEEWVPSVLNGVEVSFTCKRNARDFVSVMKDTIKKA